MGRQWSLCRNNLCLISGMMSSVPVQQNRYDRFHIQLHTLLSLGHCNMRTSSGSSAWSFDFSYIYIYIYICIYIYILVCCLPFTPNPNLQYYLISMSDHFHYCLNEAFTTLNKWFKANKLASNSDKNSMKVFTNKQNLCLNTRNKHRRNEDA